MDDFSILEGQVIKSVDYDEKTDVFSLTTVNNDVCIVEAGKKYNSTPSLMIEVIKNFD